MGEMAIFADQRTGPANRRVRSSIIYSDAVGCWVMRSTGKARLSRMTLPPEGRRLTDAYPDAPRPHVQRAATDRRCSYRTPWVERRSSGVGFVRIATSADRFAARFDAELQRRGMFIPNVEDLDDLLERALPIVGDPFLDARASRARARIREIFVALRAWAP
jgi:hypothetical protein